MQNMTAAEAMTMKLMLSTLAAELKSGSEWALAYTTAKNGGDRAEVARLSREFLQHVASSSWR